MSLINEIINWVENKPIFWQVAMDRIIRKNELTDSDISELKEICKSEVGLSKIKFDIVNFNELKEFANKTSSYSNITISKISQIENINALSSSGELDFSNSGLTLIYGDNGSGKSSYVSILKNTCNTRGQKPIINGNLFDPTSFYNDKKATVTYTESGTTIKKVNLVNNNISDNSLKCINVFDTFSANHYIEGEDEIAFIPYGLSYIEKFASCLKRIEIELNSELSVLTKEKFDYFLIEVDANSTAKNFLNNLNSNTTLDQLRTEGEWNNVKKDRIEVLRKEKDQLQKLDPIKLTSENEVKIKLFTILKNKIENIENLLFGKSLEEFKLIVNNYNSTKQALSNVTNKIFSELPIEGIGNNSWKILWESARKFYNESIKEEVFPETNVNNNCPLCLQNLEPEARERFVYFEEFVKNDIQKAYDFATEKYTLMIEKLDILEFSMEEQEPAINELDSTFLNFSQDFRKYMKRLKKQKNQLIDFAKSKVEAIETINIESTPKDLINFEITKLKDTNEKFKNQSIENKLKPIIEEYNQLKGVHKIYEYKPKLAREIFRQKKLFKLNQCISKCNTRMVTILSNELTTKYVTHSLKQNFKFELQRLGFKNIKIETKTKGERGIQYHYLRLDEQNANNVTLKDILSEGEHRCISLATFFSELSISNHKSSIIFDDPVSSLDHKWRNKISKRIVEESENRQVIVFTHDITFLMMIQEHSNDLNKELNIICLTRKQKETGIVGNNPPWDALNVNKRIGFLKSAYQQLEKIERIGTEEEYKERVKSLYGKLRETWERFIEEIYLNNAIQRFGRVIQTKRLSQVVDLTTQDYKLIESNISKCSTYFIGHDTAGALIEEIPDSSEFKSDIQVLEEYIIKIKVRRKQM